MQTPDIRGRAKLRKLLYAKPTIIALFALMAFVISGTWSMYGKHKIAKVNMEREREILLEMQAKEEVLRRDIEKLSSERGIEQEIRDRYMVAKEGEGVIVIADEKGGGAHTITVTDSSTANIAGVGITE